MKQDIENIVDALPSTNAGGNNTRPKFKRTKFLGKLSPLGITLFAVAIAAGVLISSFFTVYYVQMSGQLDVTGSEAPLFYWDDTVPFVGDTCARQIDITEMTAGDTEAFPHNILNADSGLWKITFDLSEVTFTDPMDPAYGFYFSISDYAVNGVPCDLGHLVISPGQKATFNYNYEIDAEMVTPDDPIDFQVVASIDPYVEFIDAIADSIPLVSPEQDLHVLTNDITDLGCHISSVNGAGLPSDTHVTIDAGGQFVHLSTGGTGPKPWTFTYTITSDHTPGLTDTATVTIT